jgi:hypothetical protein
LHGHDFHDFVLESVAQEVVDNLILLDGQSKQVDFLKRFDFALTNKAAEFSDGLPNLLVTISITSSSASTTASSTALSITAATVTSSASASASATSTSTESSTKVTSVA